MITVQDILELYRERLVGFREARSLLGCLYPAYLEIRDTDLDTDAETRALTDAEDEELQYRESMERLHNLREEQGQAAAEHEANQNKEED